jgi:hypothetical protein
MSNKTKLKRRLYNSAAVSAAKRKYLREWKTSYKQ